MAMINIGGADLPDPTSYKIPNFDLDSDDSHRNELGVLQRDRIRNEIYKAELEFKVNSSDLALIKSAISPTKVNVRLISETGPITKVMYAGDRNIEMIKYDSDYNKIIWSISFNLIEY